MDDDAADGDAHAREGRLTPVTRRLRESVSVRRAADDVLDVSVSTVRRLVAAGAFPGAFRVGPQIRIPRSDLANYRRRHLVTATHR